MTVIIMTVIILFLTGMQAGTPYFVKRTVVFGVTIPEGHTEDRKLGQYKKYYMTGTLLTGFISAITFIVLSLNDSTGATIVGSGLALQFITLLVSMILYVVFHSKTAKRKQDNEWGATLKQIRVVDLSSRSADEMLPTIYFTLPMTITIGLIIYTTINYEQLPHLIPTHWGPTGAPDAFSEKNPFSAVALLLILLVMQGMMSAINYFTKKSGIKLNATNKNKSKIQQLTFRKYTSWFLFLTTLLSTLLLAFFQLTIIHEEIGGTLPLITAPVGFLVISLIGTAIYAYKIGQGGARIQIDLEEQSPQGITDVDEDLYWKAGVFYVNKNDPSIFVEKRFGVGWTINLGNPIGYFILFGPIAVILAIAFFL